MSVDRSVALRIVSGIAARLRVHVAPATKLSVAASEAERSSASSRNFLTFQYDLIVQTLAKASNTDTEIKVLVNA